MFDAEKMDNEIYKQNSIFLEHVIIWLVAMVHKKNEFKYNFLMCSFVYILYIGSLLVHINSWSCSLS
jgi:hypothetical protein